ncbi:MAG: DUF4199 domain-containing protein [Candidatus Levybacteria bacterium]|nr:DUF4199 domain-containing protein [Candidatus Levybacteria bacterium]
MKTNAVKYGLALSASIAIWIALMHSLGLYNGEKSDLSFVDYFYIVIPIVGLYLGIKEKKERELRGKMTLQQGIREGFIISLVYGITSPFIFYVYYTMVNPQAIDFAKRVYSMMRFTNNEVILADMAAQFIFAVIGGIVISTVVSYLLTKKK